MPQAQGQGLYPAIVIDVEEKSGLVLGIVEDSVLSLGLVPYDVQTAVRSDALGCKLKVLLPPVFDGMEGDEKLYAAAVHIRFNLV